MASYISVHPTIIAHSGILITLLLIIGIIIPAIIAFSLISANSSLSSDLRSRFLTLKGIRPVYLFLTAFLMLGSILLAQVISLFFGYSADQFHLANQSSFHGGVLPGWFWIFFASLAEELAWHTYGTDCLRNRMNLLWTCILFAAYWAIWHYPLFLIQGYYQNNVAHLGLMFSLNFMFSIFPFVVLMNCLYYKTNRNVLIAIVFHITAGYFNELFNTDPHSKIIQTILLAILALGIIFYDRNFFLKKPYSTP
ncbi:CPBP family intramembrane metalloprotease [Legionella longbeachae]|uniref:CPBP family glutamic-type intramembrane protease n=1 Tax=Legionella longbeachae TaxID=450 RepID=UPI000A1C00E9|nr:CPBP family glutamic-type intramembrane protease [Legionella longbeachae]ARM35001.1 CPBP family intramembrane metalloprotease [Legionella longbeachae]